uniref:Uncharacterized protein n=1 Tax=uncultured marine group II/III euryarchaeote AD1000_49_E05 TaxID=1457779 RepID=A0A075FTF5_9EURY|nr:hypothetical protein [uncultured marine group II/III euryarchaeote AD1000_49_E05]|tara:strand:+ start:185 stop:625 length:441 start_codon:yes stop_codon:yes gene_type:complete
MEQISADAVSETRTNYPFLATNEKILLEMRGIVGLAVANPVVRLFYAIGEILALLVGFRNIATLIVTDQRAIINSRSYVFWVFEASRNFTTFLPGGSANVSSGFAAGFLWFFKKSFVRINHLDFGARGHTVDECDRAANLIFSTLR